MAISRPASIILSDSDAGVGQAQASDEGDLEERGRTARDVNSDILACAVGKLGLQSLGRAFVLRRDEPRQHLEDRVPDHLVGKVIVRRELRFKIADRREPGYPALAPPET